MKNIGLILKMMKFWLQKKSPLFEIFMKEKRVLDMACGLLILTCNESLLEVLGNYKKMLMYSKADSKELAGKIKFILNMNTEDKKKIAQDLRNIVVENHNIERLITKILKNYAL
jgi:spore maturation protein CgeB